MLLTLLINGTTTKALLKALGMSKEEEIAKRMLRKVLDEHDEKAIEFVKSWKSERNQYGDRGGLFYEQGDLNYEQLKEFRNELASYVSLKEIFKHYPDLATAVDPADSKPSGEEETITPSEMA